MTDAELESRLATLLEQAGHHHHAAYLAAEGIDPEWALWYASYIQARFWDEGGSLPTRSQLVYLLVDADRAHDATGRDADWPHFYARRILADLGTAQAS